MLAPCSELFGGPRVKPYPELLIWVQGSACLSLFSSFGPLPSSPAASHSPEFLCPYFSPFVLQSVPSDLFSAWCIPLYPWAFLTAFFCEALPEGTSSPTIYQLLSVQLPDLCSFVTVVIFYWNYFLHISFSTIYSVISLRAETVY